MSYSKNQHGMTRDGWTMLRACGASAKRRGITILEHYADEGERYGTAAAPPTIDLLDFNKAAKGGAPRRIDIQTFRERLEDASKVVAEAPDHAEPGVEASRALSLSSALEHLLDDVREWVCDDKRAANPFYLTTSWDRLEMVRTLWQDEIERNETTWTARHMDPFWPARKVLRTLLAVALVSAATEREMEAVA